MTYYGISGTARAAGNKAARRVSAQESVRRTPARITPAVPSTARVNGRTAIKSVTASSLQRAGTQVKKNGAVGSSISADTKARRCAQRTNQSAHTAVGSRISSAAGVKAHTLTKSRTRIKYINTAGKSAPMPVHLICGAIMITLLFLFFVYNCVQLNEYNSKTVQLKKQIDNYTQEYFSLEKRLEDREDINVIEQKAISIGMIKKDLLPKKYVSVIDGDKIEVIKENTEQAGISTLLSGISKSILNIKEYLKG
jgi:hypothetical protein